MNWIRLLGCAAVPLVLTAAGCLRGQRGADSGTPKGEGETRRPQFTDITAAAGIRFRQRHGGCGKAYFVEQTGAGVALLDVEGDGDLDLYFPQPTWLGSCKPVEQVQAHLFLNDGKANFTPVPGAAGATCADYGIGAAVGDYNNDGRPDLFVACYGRSHLFRNDGGRFTDVTDAAKLDRRGYSTSAAWFDYDRDDDLDLFVCGYVQFEVTMKTVCPSATGKPDYCTPEAFTPDRNALYRNNGNGTFTDVTKAAGLGGPSARALGVVAVDFDGDQREDLFVANDTAANALYRNLGNGRFANEAMVRGVAYGGQGKAQSNMGIACGDYDGDARPDVLVTTFAYEPFTLYRNQGDFFSDASAQSGLASATYLPLGFGTEFFDADQDGWLDLFFANGHVEQYINQRVADQTFAQANQLLLNDGKGGFAEHSQALPADDVRVHRGLASGDLDGDGDLDLVLTCLDDTPVVLRNDSPAGHWLTVDVRNAHGSNSVVGATVRIEAAGRKQVRWIIGGGSYISQSDYGAHFGLGTANRADRIEVTWPNGARKMLENVPVNQRIQIKPDPTPQRG